MLLNDLNMPGEFIGLWQALNLGLILLIVYGIWKIYKAITKPKK